MSPRLSFHRNKKSTGEASNFPISHQRSVFSQYRSADLRRLIIVLARPFSPPICMAILPRGHILLIPQPFLPAFRSEPSILHVFSCHRQPSNEQRQRYYSSKQPVGVFRCGFACLQSPSLWCHLCRDRARHRSASCLPRSNINRKPTSHQPD